MGDVRRFVLLLVVALGLGAAAFGVLRGLTATGPAHGVRMRVAIAPPVDDDALAMTVDAARERLEHGGAAVRVMPAAGPGPGTDQLVVEIGEDDPGVVDDLAARLEHAASLEVHAIDAGNPWIGRVAEAAAAGPRASAAGIRFDGGALVADDRWVELGVPVANTIGCTGPVEGGMRRCLVTGGRLISGYLGELAARDPSLALPADRIVAYARVDDDHADRQYVLDRAVLFDGGAIHGADVVSNGVAIDVGDAGRVEPPEPIAFVLDGRIHTVTTADLVTAGELRVATTGAAADALVAAIHAGAARPMHVVQRDAFTRATGFLPRAWPFLVAGCGLLVVAALGWRRG